MAGSELEQVSHVAQREAAPFVLIAAAADVFLALASRHLGWQLFARSDWWFWLVLAVPAVAASFVFLLGMRRLGVGAEHRRELVIGLLALMVASNLAAIALVITSLVNGRPQMQPGQLLLSAAGVLVVNVISFGLVFWEVDLGGPVRRALSEKRQFPDFQFPQDDNPAMAPQPWQPGLFDYVYVATTNSIAFSPTDAMPLTRRAKALMAVEATVAAVTILIVAARAVNILH
jgi:hypothetical protein